MNENSYLLTVNVLYEIHIHCASIKKVNPKSNFDLKKIYVFGANELITEFMNKGWGLLGLNKFVKKLQKTGTTADGYRRNVNFESTGQQNLFCFSIL